MLRKNVISFATINWDKSIYFGLKKDKFMSNDPSNLDKKADASLIQDLYSANYLDEQARKEAIKLLNPPKIMWQTWADRMLLLFSAALILAGIIFFFAFNWASMPAFLKLGLIQSVMVASLTATLIKGLDNLVGKVCLLAASIFVGVLLAVYGQIYQTGADAYQLFVGWALLITLWVILAKFGGLWLIYLLLLNIAVILFFNQTATDKEHQLVSTLGFLNIFALILREYGNYKKLKWISAPWLRWVILGATLFFLTSFTAALIIEIPQETTYWTAIAPILLVILLGLTSYYCRYYSKDLFSLTMVALSICSVILTFIGKAIFEVNNDAIIVLGFGLIVLAVVSLATFVLRNIGKAMEKEAIYGN